MNVYASRGMGFAISSRLRGEREPEGFKGIGARIKVSGTRKPV